MTTEKSSAPLDQELTRLQAENEELRRQLMQSQKLSSVGALAASITHEFNNVLTTIINYAKLGLRHKDVVMREKAFDKILAAGHRASKITTGRSRKCRWTTSKGSRTSSKNGWCAASISRSTPR